LPEPPARGQSKNRTRETIAVRITPTEATRIRMMDSVRPHQFEPLWSVQNPSAPSTMQAALEITDLPNAARYVLAVSKPCLLWSSILPAIFRCSDQVMSAAYRIGDGSHARGIHIRSSPCNVDEPLFTGESTIVDSLKRPLYHQGIVVFSQRVNVLVGPSGPSSATCTTSREPSSTDSVPAYAARPSRYASPVTLSRFRTSPRYQGRPTAADMASCIAACSQGWSESDIAAALSREYLSRDMSRTRQAFNYPQVDAAFGVRLCTVQSRDRLRHY